MGDLHWSVSLIISLIPLLLVFLVMIWHGRQVRRSLTTRDGRSLAQAIEDVARELKRSNDLRTPSA